jgi:dihydroorotate dehydrogenase
LWVVEDAAHRFLRLLPPEEAHRLGLQLLRLASLKRGRRDERLRVRTILGEVCPPVGLAAGFDKTGEHVSRLGMLGFGFLVAGSTTLHRREGNRRPRLARRGYGALVNAMGLPNPGVRVFADNLKREMQRTAAPVVASIAGEDVREIAGCYEALRGAAGAVEINLSSPSLAGAERIWSAGFVKELCRELSALKWCPLILKTPPLARAELRSSVLKSVEIWADQGMEAITAVNTLPVPEPRISVGFGGLSGIPLKPYMLETVKEISRILEDRCEIFAVGGVFSAEDVLSAIEHGARAVQIYTALAYRGPGIVREIEGGLVKALDKRGAQSLEEIMPR